MAENKNPGDSVEAPTELRMSEAIPYRAGADGFFFAKLVGYAAKFWGVGKNKVRPPEMEAIRRAAALIEGIMCGRIVIKED